MTDQEMSDFWASRSEFHIIVAEREKWSNQFPALPGLYWVWNTKTGNSILGYSDGGSPNLRHLDFLFTNYDAAWGHQFIKDIQDGHVLYADYNSVRTAPGENWAVCRLSYPMGMDPVSVNRQVPSGP